ncbi:MAG: DNA polymerase Y family protein [Rhodobacteraceae bacterium]|nr:DNA polymerase Y family protein [Paracoccaceae bacterium]
MASEQRLNPQGKSVDQLMPMVLVESGVKGTRITATNPCAEKSGALIGQMLSDARAGCPEIHVAQAEPELDQVWLERLGNWAMRYSPVVALDGADGLLIDIAGCAHLFGGEEALLNDVVMRFEKIGLTTRTGLADTPGAAWALARYGVGKTSHQSSPPIAPSGQTIEATAALPVEALRLDERVLLLLRRLGLKTIGAVRAIPRAALERRFRSREAAFSVQLRLDQMAGNIREPLAPLKETPPFREVLACPEPALETGAISMALDHLLQRLNHRLERDGLGARTLTLTASHSDGGHDALHVKLGRAARDPAHIVRLFKDRLEQIDPGFGIDLFILAADRVEEMAEDQQSLTAEASSRDVILLIDRLMNRLGAEHITRLVPVESHLPERAQKIIPAGLAEQAVAWDVPIATARPFRLFERPEAIETIAEVPDGPPLRFTWRRLVRKVVRTRGPERIAPEWWRDISGPQLLLTNARDYYEVEDMDGVRYWLFRAGLYGEVRNGNTPQWFIHGLFG